MVTRALAQDVTSLAGQVSSTIAALGTVTGSVQALTPRVTAAEQSIMGLQQLANATAAEVARLDSTLGCRTAPAAVAFGSVTACSVFFPNGQRCAPVCTKRTCHDLCQHVVVNLRAALAGLQRRLHSVWQSHLCRG
jgi:hypothetical protein